MTPADTSPSPTRSRYLLEKAADALEDGRNPLDRSFLIENAVTADECLQLADSMAAAIRFTSGMIDLDRESRRKADR